MNRLRYPLCIRCLHWMMAVGVVVQLALGWGAEALAGEAGMRLLRLHFQWGMVLLVMLLLRKRHRLITLQHHRGGGGDCRAAGHHRDLARLGGARVAPRWQLLATGETIGRAVAAELVVLFRFHSPILEPDLDLALVETECVRDLDAALARQVAMEMKLLLQLQGLEARVGLARALLPPAINVCSY